MNDDFFDDFSSLMECGETKTAKELIEIHIASGGSSKCLGEILTFSALHGELEIVKLLLANNVNPNATIDGRGYSKGTALIFAIQSEHLELVKLLLDNKADPNTVGTKGATALKLATGWRISFAWDRSMDDYMKNSDLTLELRTEVCARLILAGAKITPDLEKKKIILDSLHVIAKIKNFINLGSKRSELVKSKSDMIFTKTKPKPFLASRDFDAMKEFSSLPEWYIKDFPELSPFIYDRNRETLMHIALDSGNAKLFLDLGNIYLNNGAKDTLKTILTAEDESVPCVGCLALIRSHAFKPADREKIFQFILDNGGDPLQIKKSFEKGDLTLLDAEAFKEIGMSGGVLEKAILAAEAQKAKELGDLDDISLEDSYRNRKPRI